jgi:hypothetical protein
MIGKLFRKNYKLSLSMSLALANNRQPKHLTIIIWSGHFCTKPATYHWPNGKYPGCYYGHHTTTDVVCSSIATCANNRRDINVNIWLASAFSYETRLMGDWYRHSFIVLCKTGFIMDQQIGNWNCLMPFIEPKFNKKYTSSQSFRWWYKVTDWHSQSTHYTFHIYLRLYY